MKTAQQYVKPLKNRYKGDTVFLNGAVFARKAACFHCRQGRPAAGGKTMMIYVVEDDNNIRKLVDYALRKEGYEVMGFAMAAPFWTAMERQHPQLILLDIMLPGEDGLSILKRVRASAATARIPVIMLTAKGSEYDKVMGLDLGADDYVAKPFGMLELMSRIRAVLRRTEDAKEPDTFTWGEIVLCPAKHTVTVGGEAVALTYKEYELLALLLKSNGNVLTRDALLEQIWGYTFDGETRTVDVHIRKLRQKLGSAGRYIETVKGVGYKLGGGEEDV